MLCTVKHSSAGYRVHLKKQKKKKKTLIVCLNDCKIILIIMWFISPIIFRMCTNSVLLFMIKIHVHNYLKDNVYKL